MMSNILEDLLFKCYKTKIEEVSDIRNHATAYCENTSYQKYVIS